MARDAERWVRDNFDVRLPNPRDRHGESIVWSEKAVRFGGGGIADIIGRQIAYTYLADFLAMAKPIIEDKRFKDDAAILSELQERGIAPRG